MQADNGSSLGVDLSVAISEEFEVIPDKNLISF